MRRLIQRMLAASLVGLAFLLFVPAPMAAQEADSAIVEEEPPPAEEENPGAAEEEPGDETEEPGAEEEADGEEAPKQEEAAENAAGSPAAELLLASATGPVGAGDGFEVSLRLPFPVPGGAAVLTVAYDARLFAYGGYTPAEGVAVAGAEEDAAAGMVSIILTTANAQGFENLGLLALQARADAALPYGSSIVNAGIRCGAVEGDETAAEEDAGEYAQSLAAALEIATRGITGDTNGDGVVDLIDLSNLNGWFGLTAEDGQWPQVYYFDYNGNNEIDVADIAQVVTLL